MYEPRKAESIGSLGLRGFLFLILALGEVVIKVEFDASKGKAKLPHSQEKKKGK